MSKPLTPAEIIAAFKRWKVPYNETRGWQTRSNGGQWADVTMLGFHHTATNGPDDTDRDLLIRGYKGLPGPLCNFGSRDKGVIDIISAGPANHFGKGDPDVLAAVRKESYGDYPPKTNENQESRGAVGGNSVTYGWEVYYAGPKDPKLWGLQYRVTILSMAAITEALAKKSGDKWTAKSMIGHKEWSNWKIDPQGVDMKVARADLQWCLDKGPTLAYEWYKTNIKGPVKVPTPTPTPTPQPPRPTPPPPIPAPDPVTPGPAKPVPGEDEFVPIFKDKDDFVATLQQAITESQAPLVKAVEDLTAAVQASNTGAAAPEIIDELASRLASPPTT